MTESALDGGRVTPGVVRVGDTVRRPVNDNSPFVHDLLRHLEGSGFAGAPRFLGIDERGREVLSFIEGDVPDDIRPDYPEETLREAALLIRAYHDATAGFAAEVVCHNDLGPPNTVFRDGSPVALIDFDAAAPGARMYDLAYAVLLWVDLGSDERSLEEQGRRARAFLDAYEISLQAREVVDAMLERQRQTAESLRGRSREMSDWWGARAAWLERNRAELEEALG